MNNDVQSVALSVKGSLPSNIGTYEKIGPNTWKWALLFAYFAMVVDGIDIMLLSYSLTSLKGEFALTTFSFTIFSICSRSRTLEPIYLI